MRAATLLLMCTCLTGSAAYAQMESDFRPSATPPSATGMPADHADDKVKVGYEGRGDYLKNEQIAKEKANPSRYGKKAAATDSAANGTASRTVGISAPFSPPAFSPPAVPAEEQAAASVSQHQRSDSTLRSDTRKPAAPAAAAQADTSAAPAPAAASQAAPASAPYSPPVFVGGRRIN